MVNRACEAIHPHARRPRGRWRWVAALALAWVAASSGPPTAAAQQTAVDAARRTDGAAGDGATAPSPEPSPGPPGATPRSAVRGFLEAVDAHDYVQAATFLDLSRTRVAGAELARHLEVVLDKTLWIDPARLSDEPGGASDDGLPPNRDSIGSVELGKREVPILLARTGSGGQPAWKFAAATVSEIPRLYEAHGYGPLGTYLPDFFFELRLLDLQLWQWIALMALVIAAGMASWAIASFAVTITRRTLARRAADTSAEITPLLTGPARLAIAVLLFSTGKHLLELPLAAAAILDTLEDLVLVLAATWAALRLVGVVGDLVERRLRDRGEDAAVTLVPPGRKTLKAFVLVIAALAAFDTMGFDVTAVLAGLGVGSIAVALAAQKTVENLFGGATLYGDRPVRVGDFCRFGDHVGTVEEIGLRSTRVRTLDRTVVTVPNSEFANMPLENYTRRDRIWYHPRIGLRYETTPDQLRYILVEVRKMLYAHPRVHPDPARIRFVEFGAYSLDLDVFAYVNVTDYGEFLEVAEDLNLRIMDIVERAGSGFAFPSQTTYLEQGDPLDTKRQEQIEAAVARWREERELYLPRFPAEKVRELRNTLDFPERGSPAGNGSG